MAIAAAREKRAEGALLSLISALLLGCGGGSSTAILDPAPAPPPASSPPPPETKQDQSAAGIWKGSIEFGEPGNEIQRDALCLITEESVLACLFPQAPPGQFLIPVVVKGLISVVGETPSGGGTAYAGGTNSLSDAETVSVGSFTVDGGTIAEHDSITLDISIEGIAHHLSATYDAAYEAGEPLSNLSGVYGETGVHGRFQHIEGDCGDDGSCIIRLTLFRTLMPGGLSIDPDGAFFLQYSEILLRDVTLSCVHSGSIEAMSDSLNVYQVTMKLEDAGFSGCMGQAGDYDGVAFIDGGSLVIAVFNEERWIAVFAERPH